MLSKKNKIKLKLILNKMENNKNKLMHFLVKIAQLIKVLMDSNIK